MIRILIIFFLLICDVITKQLVFYSIDLNNFIPVTFYLDLAHIHNFGISFGLLSGLVSPWFLIFIGLFVTGLIYYMMKRTNNKMEKIGLLIIIAGALSNIFDRAINGYVIDFIYLHYKDFYWPAFNFADIYISIGVFIVVLQLLKDLHKRLIK